jgi:hypothetical protein
MRKTMAAIALLTLTSTGVFAGSSFENRADSKITLQADLFGIDHSAIAQGIGVNYQISSTKSLGLKAVKLSGSSSEGYRDNDEEDKIWSENGEGTAVNITYKQYVGNSFYITPGVYYRNQHIVNSTTSRYSYSSFSDSTLIGSDEADIEDLGFSFRIGNNWSFSKLSIGCDWVGLNKSITVLDSDGTIEERSKNSLNLLNFYLSYSI